MVDQNASGKVQTVLGPIDPESLGITLTHEHLLIDIAFLEPPRDRASDKGFYEKPVSLETIGPTKNYSLINRQNFQLNDIPTAIDEVNLYKQYGGQSLVEATSIGISRDPVGLARISRATGINVIMGGSYYVHTAHPSNMNSLSQKELSERIIKDVVEGVEDTTIKSGIIGEIGCSWPLEDNERKVLKASAQAQLETGAPILIHPGGNELAPLEILEVLNGAGANLERVIMGHLDRTIFNYEKFVELAKTGCYMEWDVFGKGGFSVLPKRPGSKYDSSVEVKIKDKPTDAMKLDTIHKLILDGYGTKIVISQDVDTRDRLEKYGGHGYSFILRNIVPAMRNGDFTEQNIEDILVNNPRDILTFGS